MAGTKTWALLDYDGEPVRFYSYAAEGTMPWPPGPAQLPADHPDWDNPLF